MPWKHIRRSHPIEGPFATVRHRTKHTKGDLSRQTGLAKAFKPMIAAQGKWRKLNGRHRLPEIIQRVEFRDSLRQLQTAAGAAIINFRPELARQKRSCMHSDRTLLAASP